MKKSKKSPRAKKSTSRPTSSKREVDTKKRATLATLRNVGLGVLLLGGGGLFGVRAVQATIAEADLSRVGTGTRTVVQIHDPQCALCTTLQRQTRRVLKEYTNDEALYLVANIKSNEGSAFARRYGVPHVTLLFFDEDGTLKGQFRGPAAQGDVDRAVRRHLGRPQS